MAQPLAVKQHEFGMATGECRRERPADPDAIHERRQKRAEGGRIVRRKVAHGPHEGVAVLAPIFPSERPPAGVGAEFRREALEPQPDFIHDVVHEIIEVGQRLHLILEEVLRRFLVRSRPKTAFQHCAKIN